MENTGNTGDWRGLVLSAICPGAAHFRSGNRRRGLRWLLSLLPSFALVVFLILSPAVNLKLALLAALGWLVLWLVMLWDARHAPEGETSNGLLVLAALSFLYFYSAGWLVHGHLLIVPNDAMAPTLQSGDRILSQSYAYWWRTPQRSELVVFKTDGVGKLPDKLSLVFRVAAMPGQRVAIQDGRLTVDGRPVSEPDPLNFPLVSYVVPEGHYFLLGDNSTNAIDSRYFGPIPRKNITGRVTRICWPAARAGTPR